MYTDPSGCITVDTVFDILGLIGSVADFIDTPSWENLGWVVLDLVCLAVPILTGSYAIKATAKGAQYVGGFVDYGKTTVKAVNYASDAAEVIAKTDLIPQVTKYAKSIDNPLLNLRYTDRVLNNIGKMSNIDDVFHAFPRIVDNYYDSASVIKPFIGGDKLNYMLVKIPGYYNGYPGYFEYIYNVVDMSCNHRFFRPLY